MVNRHLQIVTGYWRHHGLIKRKIPHPNNRHREGAPLPNAACHDYIKRWDPAGSRDSNEPATGVRQHSFPVAFDSGELQKVLIEAR